MEINNRTQDRLSESILVYALSFLMDYILIEGLCISLNDEKYVIIHRDGDLYCMDYDMFQSSTGEYLGDFEFEHGKIIRTKPVQ